LATSGIISLAGLISEQLARIESALDTAATPNHTRLSERVPFPEAVSAPQHDRAGVVDCASILIKVRELQRQVDRLLFLDGCMTLFVAPLPLSDVISRLMDALWQRNQLAFAALVLGESELGPYFYHDLRGMIDARRYLKKQCPLPLWGELAHALVRRLDPEEPDYLFIDNIAKTGRPTPTEFPWMPRNCSLIILPLRKETVAIGALILGGSSAEYFVDSELRLELAEFAAVAARSIISAQIEEELHERSGQLVGLQLFTRSIAATTSSHNLLAIIVDEIAELMGATSILMAFHDTLAGPNLLQLLMAAPGACTHQYLAGIGAISNDAPSVLLAKLHRLLVWTIDAGQSLFLDPSQPLESPENLYYNETGRALMTPITIGDHPLGALYIEASPNMPGYDEEDMVVLRTAMNAIAITLQQIG
jgi:GAF domain-containing protein